MSEAGEQNDVIQPADFKRAQAPAPGPRLQVRPVVRALLGAFALLALVALFIFNARSVQLATEPAGAEVWVSGWLPRWSLGERQLLLGGATYTVHASFPGYQELEEAIVVGDAESQEFRFALVKLPGELTIETSEPSEGAEALLEGGPGTGSLHALREVQGDLSVWDPPPPNAGIWRTPPQGGSDSSGLHAAQESQGDRSDRAPPPPPRSGGELPLGGGSGFVRADGGPSPSTARVGELSQRLQVVEEGGSGLVTLAQVRLGATPLTVDLPAGGHRLAVVHPRYLGVTVEVEMRGMGEAQGITVSLEPAWATVSVSSVPAGAAILLDGEDTGTVTPTALEVVQGRRELSLALPGYKPWRTELAVVAQRNQTLPEATLLEEDGTLELATEPPGAYLTLGGDYRGQTPLTVPLAPREAHELLLTLSGYHALRRTLAVQPGEAAAVSLALQPIVGVINVTARPAEAQLFIDGEAAGSASQRLELTARKHELRIELAGYETFRTVVIPQEELEQRLDITLQTLEAAKAARIPEIITAATGEQLRLINPRQNALGTSREEPGQSALGSPRRDPGRLTLGAPRREPGRRSNETLREALLSRPFYAGVKEVSNQAFKQFDPGHDSGTLGRALLSREERPVVNISWNQAVEFCNWLSAQEGLPPAYQRAGGIWRLAQPVNRGYRLLTEAEWAWVARYANGPQPSRFPWGNAMPPPAGAGNFADESAAMMVPYHIIGYDDGYRGPAPPGAFPANPLGLYDLAGNVSEWVHDHYAIEDRSEAETDPLGPDAGDYHVIRGSNYTHGRFSELRWTFRDYGKDARPDLGFRIARYLE